MRFGVTGSGTLPTFSLSLAIPPCILVQRVENSWQSVDHSVALVSRAKIGPGASSEGGHPHPEDLVTLGGGAGPPSDARRLL